MFLHSVYNIGLCVLPNIVVLDRGSREGAIDAGSGAGPKDFWWLWLKRDDKHTRLTNRAWFNRTQVGDFTYMSGDLVHGYGCEGTESLLAIWSMVVRGQNH